MIRSGKVAAGTAAVLVSLLVLSGCSSGRPTTGAQASSPVVTRIAPDTFLQIHKLQVAGDPEKFSTLVPASWEVKLGDYPEGLYWGMANVLSKDAGLDLQALKGRSVQVWRYQLADGLPGEGAQATFSYPSQAILLVQNGSVVGAWLAFNKAGIGPSVKKRRLEEITGLTFDDWVKREGYFADSGANADLAKLEPVAVLEAWVHAISDGEKSRAYACLTPHALQQALTMNLPVGRLYNNGFSENNSMVENIQKGRLLSYKIFDPQKPGVNLTEVGDRTQIEIGAELALTWSEKALGGAPQQERSTRFAVMTKGPNGWKLEGLGTGP